MPGFDFTIPSEFSGEIVVEETGCMLRILSIDNEEFDEDNLVNIIVIEEFLSYLDVRIKYDRLYIWEMEL
jgi:hypothetical protein